MGGLLRRHIGGKLPAGDGRCIEASLDGLQECLQLGDTAASHTWERRRRSSGLHARLHARLYRWRLRWGHRRWRRGWPDLVVVASLASVHRAAAVATVKGIQIEGGAAAQAPGHAADPAVAPAAWIFLGHYTTLGHEASGHGGR